MATSRRSMGTIPGQRPMRLSASSSTNAPASSAAANKRLDGSSRLPRPSSVNKPKAFNGALPSHAAGPKGAKRSDSLNARRSSSTTATPRSRSATRTPQAQRMLSNITNPRVSNISNRGSHIGARGSFVGAKAVKDDRPLTDKAWQRTVVTELLAFIDEHGYASYGIKRLTPSDFPLNSAEFKNVFNFLVGILQPEYCLPSGCKLDKEVPELLKMLRYPGLVSKSSFQTLGTNHSWPSVLGVLHFLMQTCKIVVETVQNSDKILFPNQDENGFQIGEGPSEEKLLYENFIICYNAFNNGQDTFDEEIAYFESQLRQSKNLSEERYKKCLREITQLKEQIDGFRSSTGRTEDLLRNLDVINEDIADLEGFVKRSADFEKALLAEIETLQTSLKSRCSRLDILRTENEAAMKQCQVKGLDKDNVKMNEALQQLRDQAEDLRSEMREEDNNLWTLQMEMGKRRTTIEGLITQFNNCLRDIGMVEDSEAANNIFLNFDKDLSDVVHQIRHLGREFRAEELRLQQQLEDGKKKQKRLKEAKESLTSETELLKKELHTTEVEEVRKENKLKENDKSVAEELESVKTTLLTLRERGHQNFQYLREKEANLKKEIFSHENKIEKMQSDGMDCLEALLTKVKTFVHGKEQQRDAMYRKVNKMKEDIKRENEILEQAMKLHIQRFSDSKI